MSEAAIGLKNHNQSMVLGQIEYNTITQRELAYKIESIAPIGSLNFASDEEHGKKFPFPGYAWTVVLRRYQYFRCQITRILVV